MVFCSYKKCDKQFNQKEYYNKNNEKKTDFDNEKSNKINNKKKMIFLF